nr:fumarylacetoacetate hydrolase family protein [Litorivivens lipolytica]
MTSVAGQQRFNLREPVAGVLWPDSALRFDGDKAVIKRADFRKPMLEMELAFRVNTLIPEPLADVSEVQYVVAEVMPALEIPDLGFDSTVGMTGEAIVAANAGARAFLLGPALDPESVDINAVRARLRLDGSTLQRGDATQVMGNQWKALFWLINTLVEQGWVIQPGQVLLTGAMGNMIPLETGVYEAHFNGLGYLRLQVE